MFGRRWFSVDHKSFEIEEVGEGRKTKIFITERSRGRSSWIRFGKDGVKILIKGLETYASGGAGRIGEGTEWKENGRRYSLKLRKNERGRFILCSVADLDGKWYGLAFPEGNGLRNGWSQLAEALQDLAMKEDNGGYSIPAKSTLPSNSVKDKDCLSQNLNRVVTTTQECGKQNKIWIDISENIPKRNLEMLKNGLVGGWKSQKKVEISLAELEVWAIRAWRLKGRVRFQQLNQNLFFLDFELVDEAYWVLDNGSRICKGEAMELEWWSPSTGCKGRVEEEKEAWLRVLGLPLHLWSEEILKKIGNGCGGYVAMDKETEQRKDLRWARILVKQDMKGKPSSANLLAGARSYELQLWWEFQPRMMEVYPRKRSSRNFMEESRGEEEESTRAPGRVSAANENLGYLSRDWQIVEGHRKAKVKSGTGKGEVQGTTRAGEVNVEPKNCVEATYNVGRSVREEGDKNGGSSGSGLGCQNGKQGAQIVCFEVGPKVGQSPNCIGKQEVWPSYSHSGFNDREDCRVKERGKGKEIIEGGELVCLGSCQRREDKAEEARAQQEKNPTLTLGQREHNDIGRGKCREEFGIPNDTFGKQNAEKGRAFGTLDRESFSGKFPNHKNFITVGGGDDGGVGINTGEKIERSLTAADGLGNAQTEVGIKSLSCPHGIPWKKAKKTVFEEEDDFDTRAARKARTGTKLLGQLEGTRMAGLCRLQNQEMNQELVREEGYVCGSDSIDVLETASGRKQCRALGVDHLRLGQMGLSPSQFSGPGVDGPIQLVHMSFEEKDEGGDYGVKQNSVLRLTAPPEDRVSTSGESYIVEERKKEVSKEDGVIRVDQPQEEDCVQSKRYTDKFYDQSPSSGFSVFGRPLLLGGCSGVGGVYGVKELEIMRNEGGEVEVRGKMAEGEIIAVGEDVEDEARSEEGGQIESTGAERYDSWESSSLAKFSEVLGFSTKGFEKEILELLRNLVASLKSGKVKGNTTVTKSERELRRLKSTINYNGKQSINGGGRDKGNLQEKL